MFNVSLRSLYKHLKPSNEKSKDIYKTLNVKLH